MAFLSQSKKNKLIYKSKLFIITAGEEPSTVYSTSQTTQGQPSLAECYQVYKACTANATKEPPTVLLQMNYESSKNFLAEMEKSDIKVSDMRPSAMAIGITGICVFLACAVPFFILDLTSIASNFGYFKRNVYDFISLFK